MTRTLFSMFAKTKITLTCFLYYFSGQSLQKVLRSLFLLPHFLSLCTWLIFTLFVHVYLLFSLSLQKLLVSPSLHSLTFFHIIAYTYFFSIFAYTFSLSLPELFFLPYLHTNSKNVALFCIPLLFSVMRTISFFHSLHMLTAPFLQLCVYLLFSSSLHTLIFFSIRIHLRLFFSIYAYTCLFVSFLRRLTLFTCFAYNW